MRDAITDRRTVVPIIAWTFTACIQKYVKLRLLLVRRALKEGRLSTLLFGKKINLSCNYIDEKHIRKLRH